MTDKGYDSDANRVAALARGITPVIPRRENSKQRGRFFPKRLYKLRARIEQTIGKLKRFKRVVMRCEKTDISYSAIISFACGLMLVKSVHTAVVAWPKRPDSTGSCRGGRYLHRRPTPATSNPRRTCRIQPIMMLQPLRAPVRPHVTFGDGAPLNIAEHRRLATELAIGERRRQGIR